VLHRTRLEEKTLMEEKKPLIDELCIKIPDKGMKCDSMATLEVADLVMQTKMEILLILYLKKIS